MTGRFRNTLIVCLMVLALSILSGCAKKSYGTQEQYVTVRANELYVEPSAGTAVEPSTFRWNLLSGQAWIDRLSTEGGQVRVLESIQFGSPEEADAWLAKEASEGQPPKQTIEQYRAARKAELSATSGAFVRNGEESAYYAWQLPDGTFMRDTVTISGNDVAVTESKPYPTRDTLVAELGETLANFDAYIAQRSEALGGAVLDWGENRRSWNLYAFRMPDGQYTLDIVKPDGDHLSGVIRVRSQTFPSLDDAVGYVATQAMDRQAAWTTASQYSRFGWATIGFVLLIVAFVLFNVNRSRKGSGATIRRIAGLDQIDEAVGRATEIARPVLMVPGLGTLNGITVQALTVFAYVIRTAARFGTPIRLLNADASVYAVAQEIAREVYQSEGVPEQYDPNSVRFVSDRQFAFAAGVAGTIQREKVAATFFMGDFFAESMIFAENANMVGAIQVAATTQFTQTPFFIAACDYVLLGDEFYAASAYLGRQPVLVGSLIGVDWSKMMIMGVVLLGALTHSVQTMKPVPMGSLPPETAKMWEGANQRYFDWRKDDLFFKRLVKVKRS
ncbi:MAG: DUF6754 domain-containing protein [Fimbriimonadales bacterium]